MDDAKRIAQLQVATFAAENAHRELCNQMKNHGADRIKELEIKLAEEAQDIYGDRIAAAAQEVSRAKQEEIDFRDQVARKANDAPYPLGTVLYEWDSQRFCNTLYPTGKRGILEVVTKDSVHPDNISCYSRAGIGEYVVRLLKKDGSLSKTYARLNHWRTGNWYPEGRIPKNADKSYKSHLDRLFGKKEKIAV